MEMYNALVTAAARRGDVDAAQEAVLRCAPRVSRATGTPTTRSCGAAGSAVRPDLAWRWYEEAKTTGTVEITRHHFTMLVIASGRGGDMDKMFEAEAEMRAAGLEPDEQTWCELLSSCARHGDAALTWDTYKRSRKAGQPPSEVALNILIGVTLSKIRALTDPDDRRNIKRAQWDADDDDSDRKRRRSPSGRSGPIEPSPRTTKPPSRGSGPGSPPSPPCSRASARPRCRPCAPWTGRRGRGPRLSRSLEPSPTRTRRTRMRESTTRFARSSCTRRLRRSASSQSSRRRRTACTTSGSSPRGGGGCRAHHASRL